MHYMGGKSKSASRIAQIINSGLRPGQLYLEPFCGACCVTNLVRAKRRVVADANLDLILMWSAIQGGWSPPMGLSEQKYEELRDSEPSALRGFAGIQCSFAGKWYSGYARDPKSNRNYTYNARKSLKSSMFSLHGVVFCCADYRSWKPADAMIYCDPPYRGLTGYIAGGKFDSDFFWDQVREWSKTNTVYVSEMEAPADFKTVMDVQITGGLKSSNNRNVTRRERLFARR